MINTFRFKHRRPIGRSISPLRNPFQPYFRLTSSWSFKRRQRASYRDVVSDRWFCDLLHRLCFGCPIPLVAVHFIRRGDSVRTLWRFPDVGGVLLRVHRGHNDDQAANVPHGDSGVPYNPRSRGGASFSWVYDRSYRIPTRLLCHPLHYGFMRFVRLPPPRKPPERNRKGPRRAVGRYRAITAK